MTVSLLAERDGSTDVVIIDRFGTLEELYTLSEKKSLSVDRLTTRADTTSLKLCNLKKPVCIGPNMKNFEEISTLAIQHGVATTVKDVKELTDYINSEYEPIDFVGFFEAIDNDKKNKKLSSLRGVISSVLSD